MGEALNWQGFHLQLSLSVIPICSILLIIYHHISGYVMSLDGYRSGQVFRLTSLGAGFEA